MAYRIGKCVQCQVRIAVQDVNGMFTHFKEIYRVADLYYDIYKTIRLEEDEKIIEKEIIVENGHKVKIAICKNCLEQPDLKKICEELTHPESQAGNDNLLKFIRKLGQPNKIEGLSVF